MRTFLLLPSVLAAASLSGCVDLTGYKYAPPSSSLTLSSDDLAYYDDGCVAGARDAKAGMSSVYERYADQYDTRFEPYFQQGYEACWAANK